MHCLRLSEFYPASSILIIGENISLALDVIEHVNDNDLSGMMFLIDFEKAFDKLEWSFISKLLSNLILVMI